MVSGKVFFCYKESMNVKFISNHTKIRVESIVSGVGTSAKIHFEGDLVFGGFLFFI